MASGGRTWEDGLGYLVPAVSRTSATRHKMPAVLGAGAGCYSMHVSRYVWTCTAAQLQPRGVSDKVHSCKQFKSCMWSIAQRLFTAASATPVMAAALAQGTRPACFQS